METNLPVTTKGLNQVSRFFWKSFMDSSLIYELSPRFFCSSFPGTIYPGVCQFYQQLDIGSNHPNEFEVLQQSKNSALITKDADFGNLVFLSARPHISDYGKG
jgi:hypothetical protein